MKLERLQIKNFKSIVDLELINPAPFSVFVGPNGAGKSNIFEALEYGSYGGFISSSQLPNFFGGKDSILNRNINEIRYELKIQLTGLQSSNLSFRINDKPEENVFTFGHGTFNSRQENRVFASDVLFDRFSRLFINNDKLLKINIDNNEKLSINAQNLELVLKTFLEDELKKNEFIEWLQLLIPEFENIEIYSDNISGNATLLIYEKYTKKPFTKNLISDGTYNILALLTAVFQSDEPQFLCIEEPENGLNPYVIRELVEFFRQACEEKGHYIWLNTHSQTLVSALKPEELILVDKVKGATRVKQLTDFNLHGLPMDEAWLTNALGGGLPW